MKREIVMALLVLSLIAIATQLELPSAPPAFSAEGIAPAQANRATATGSDSRQASQLLFQSAQSLLDGPPIQAQIRYQIEMFGQAISGPGRFFQLGQGTGKQRVDFQYGSGPQRVHLRQIFDGRYFYYVKETAEGRSLEFVDVDQLPSGAPTASGQAPVGWSAGGLPTLLRQIAEDYQFAAPQSVSLEQQIPAWQIRGQWNRKRLARLLDGQVDHSRWTDNNWWEDLPPQIPHSVEVTLGMLGERWFPYRIVFYQFERQPNQPVARPAFTLELFQVEQPPSLPETVFDVSADDAEQKNATEFYSNRIRQLAR